MSPLHMDLQGFPWWCSIVVTCEGQRGQLSAMRVVKDRESAEQRSWEINFKQIRHREHCRGILGDGGRRIGARHVLGREGVMARVRQLCPHCTTLAHAAKTENNFLAKSKT